MSKFSELYESALMRYTRGGLLTGDLVKFRENILSSDFFKTQPENVKSKIKELLASDLNIKVANIKPLYPTAMGAGNTDYSGTDFIVDIAQELMPGKWTNFVSVPANLLTPVDTYPSLAPIPDSLKYDNKIQIQPKPVKIEDNEQVEFYKPYTQNYLSDVKGDKRGQGDRELLNQNIKIPAKEADKNPDPAKGVWAYLPKEKKK